MTERTGYPMTETTRRVSFSVNGKTIMDLARARLYENNDLPGAIDLLMHSLVTDQLSPGDRLAVAFRILDGQMDMVGTYPIDFDVVERDSKDPRFDVKAHFDRSHEKINALQEQIDALQEAVAFVFEHIDESDARRIDRLAKRDLGHAVFATKDGPGFADGLDEPPPMLRDFLDKAEWDRENPDEAENDYGWLEPDGTFHPAPFAEHLTWAQKRVMEMRRGASEETRRHIDAVSADDYLQHLGWARIHNPYQGLANVGMDPSKSLTDRQCAFLFDYYVKRGHEAIAGKYLIPDQE